MLFALLPCFFTLIGRMESRKTPAIYAQVKAKMTRARSLFIRVNICQMRVFNVKSACFKCFKWIKQHLKIKFFWVLIEML